MYKIGLGIILLLYGLIMFFLSNIDPSPDQQGLYIFTLFLLILPLTNSLLDYISLKVSKYMAKKILQDNSIIILLLHLLIDLIIAFILISILVLFLHFSIKLINVFIDKPIPMQEILIATWHNPFSLKNGWITCMLLSTLIPTMVHLVLVIGALFITIMPSEKALKQLKMYNKGQEALLESAAHYFTRITFIQTFFSFVILFMLSFPFWY